MKEDIFINIIKESLPESAKYIGDDTAYIPEKDLILTQDTMIEDVHFRTSTITPYFLGRKSIAINLSDIAAAGGVPEYILISLSMPKNIGEDFIKEFYKGVNSICKEYKTLVVGGDLTGAEKITVSVCAVGSGKGLTPANRRSANPGDVVVVTGNCGSSGAGLHILESKAKIPDETSTKFIQSHINPVPRIKEGRKILQTAITPAMMDTSDGLADALYKICLSSNVSMEVDFDEIPYDSDINLIVQNENTVQNLVLFGGEDYELIATIPEKAYEKLKQEIFIKKIGIVKPAENEPFAYINFKTRQKIRLDEEILGSSPGLFKHFE
ncbi:MAG: thiamine-phosphate kinase [Candidatus Melainabacteria bacterium GWF2_37_15]|nr:MAG: thiamine-phosphate kinase [Candidatus Melainabacteria bacterium GWF2_37_15]